MPRDPRVDAYIAKAKPFARPILERIRAAVHAADANVEEAIKWGAPAFMWKGRILLIVAAFKAHVAINFWRGKELDFAPLKIAAEPGEAMGQLGKISGEGDLPSGKALEALVRQAIALEETVPGNSAPAKKKPAVRVPALPAPFAAALAANPAAKTNFDGFPPSARRDYIEWIAEAKRETTRDRRIATAVEWLAEGKRRNWKYESC